MEYAAEEHSNMFLESRDSEGRPIRWSATHRARQRLRHRGRIIATWREALLASGNNTPGLRVVGAIGPLLDQWVDRGWGGLSFRMTQVMTGHGNFGHFLGRIGREQDSRYHHCSAGDDTAQHTLGECPAWADEREALVRLLGRDLSLPAVITAILEEERSWHAFASFCEKVISQKEAA
ncbi:PREDICTED: uncharacterized protein LOC105560363 [Vollenhovia emeryi]|uniref:uncharacterized protein LOC105560363 n=1 Tax=Vollenhovia emeryi TaxID=411798 RepID=UPI0005F41D49|nr:PREDICTED: uncharacterized protein LOC105560363 [Vollenhovia emeryi]